METTKRRGFFQRMFGLAGGALGVAALQNSTVAESTVKPVRASFDGALRLHLNCRHQHAQGNGRSVCRAMLLDKPEGSTVGEFHANSFRSESALGSANPFAASNIEMHTIRLADGTLFGMGANDTRANEQVHAIIGGTGRFAGARGTYTITGSRTSRSELVINLMS
jgi:hypothetical protein